MNYHDSVLGFAFTSVKLQVTAISAMQNQFSISMIDEIYLNEEIDFARDKETKIISLLQTAYEELSLKNSITSNSVSFSLPQELFITTQLPVEQSLLHSDLSEEFRWQLSIMYPYLNWNDYVVRYFETDIKRAGQSEHALIFAMNRKYLKIINDFCSKNNLKLKFIDHCHLASNNIVVMNPSEKQNDQLSIYISQKILSVLISNEGKPVYYEDIPVTSFHNIRSLIAEKLNDLSNKQFNITEAFLFGDSISNSVVKVLSESTGIKFSLINPFSRFKVETKFMTNKYYTETNHLFSPSTGIAVRI
jgi:Tfp pilus assembly PilM family ATPase